jgi:hypothetical protein
MNRTDVIMGPQLGARKAFQNYAESAGRNIKAAGLEPDTIRVGYPKTVIFQVNVSNEVFAASLIRIEAVRKTIESSDGHLSAPKLRVNRQKRRFHRTMYSTTMTLLIG